MKKNLCGGLAKSHSETMTCDADLALEEIEELRGQANPIAVLNRQ